MATITLPPHTINNLISSVSKLTEANYADWKFDLTMILRQAGGSLFNITTGVITRPSSLADLKEVEKWDSIESQGLAIVGLTVDHTQKEYIRSAKTGNEAWANLKEIHEKNSTSKRTSLKRAFYAYQHDTSLPISTYISDITSAANSLKAIGITLSDLDITDVLIYSLAPEYSDVATALMTRSDRDTLKIAAVTAALREKGARLALEKGSDDSEQGPAAFAIQRNCAKCGKPGHSALNCWKDQKCDSCGKMGHIAKVCRQKESANFNFSF